MSGASSALAQRQWRQSAQTAVRRAVTTSKEARSRFQALSDGGDATMSELANLALQLAHLPFLRLPGPLAELRPDVLAAAAAKLARQQAAAVEALQDRVRQLEAAVEALAGAVALLEEVPQDEPWMRCSAVFHTMPLPRIRQLIVKVYDMYRLEYDSKAAASAALCGLVTGAVEAVEAGDHAEWRWRDARGPAVLTDVARRGGEAAKRLADVCTTYLSVWMLSPYVEDEQADEMLGALTEDMVSF